MWYDRLHPIPDGLLLGVPGAVLPLARSRLLTWRGKARAGLEPFLPRTSTAEDSIGAYVRARFGDEVHERLVDALVGSIYATDTDRFSLAEVPQLAALARTNRSLLIGARRTRASTAASGTATAAAAPIFAAPAGGIGELTRATADAVVAAGGVVRLGADVEPVRRADGGWAVAGEVFDAVVLATPASVSSTLLGSAAPDAADLLADAEAADVIMVCLHVDAAEWPDRLAGRSGYLVPKPVQRTVTAASFASQKWAHWRPDGGGEILRVSLGRDGRPVLDLTDDDVVTRVLDDLALHLDVRFTPRDVRVTRWPGAFAQYRPHHAAWVDEVERRLPPGLHVTGASFRGIGLPACVRAARTIAERALDGAVSLAD